MRGCARADMEGCTYKEGYEGMYKVGLKGCTGFDTFRIEQVFQDYFSITFQKILPVFCK